MLDVVDQYKSALIVAPTSAGKTFVSYYCIEKVLRKSNDDVVVYISPSKALMNQVVGSVYARFRNKPMVGGKVLYGTFSPEYSDNCMNCQVLVTVPECLEMMLLSPDPQVQAFVSRIKYVILDEVHCINASAQGHIWEHIFLLIRFKQWLQTAESNKALNGDQARHVEVITYDERWSELELAVHKIRECPREVSYNADIELFVRGNSVQSNAPLRDTDSADITNGRESRAETPVPSEVGGDKSSTWDALVQQFHPYGVYKPEKLKMFGIPADQRLTARQVVELYSVMSEIDEQVKVEFEPSNFSITLLGQRKSRCGLPGKDCETMKLNCERSSCTETIQTFQHAQLGLHNVMPLMDDLKKSDRLPAICFSDDRDICQFLAIRVFIELQKREFNWRASPDFQRRFNLKAEDKAAKLAKRRRDEEEKERKKTKKKKTTVGEDGRKEEAETGGGTKKL
uniref:Helicase ATP-binding domain-containing protein n=1 Tax=Ditylenchus dipsaci TaxID=166011 RepID=A0A915DR67_9BILA